MTAPPGPAAEYRSVGFGTDGPPLLDPSVPFAVHTADGEPLLVRSGGTTGEAPASACDADLARLRGPRLRGFRLVGGGRAHRRSPTGSVPPHRRVPQRAHRTDRGPGDGSRRDGTRRLLFEGTFPMARYYIPREDVRVTWGRAPRHDVRVQGTRHPLDGRARDRSSSTSPGVTGPADRRDAGHRPGLLLPGAAGRVRRRRARSTGSHSLVGRPGRFVRATGRRRYGRRTVAPTRWCAAVAAPG